MPDVCIVMPCYNEEARLPADEVVGFLSEHPGVHMCFVDDGSSDGTRTILDGIAARVPQRATVLGDGRRHGKAGAVRLGVLHALERDETPLIGYWDADLATPLSEIALLVDACRSSPGCIAAIGSRIKRLGTRITRSAVRHYVGRIFATAASITLRLPVYDSQCGAKVFRRDAAETAFAEPFLTRWLFDVEVLARLRNQYGDGAVVDNVLEVPLRQWTGIDGSKLRAWHFLHAPLELWRIARRYNAGRAWFR